MGAHPDQQTAASTAAASTPTPQQPAHWYQHRRVLAAFPASVSANHRYLLDQGGRPYMIVGDSPWSLSTNLSTSDMDYYFGDRQAKGFNTALIGLLVDRYIGGRDDLSTYDGLYPFTTSND